MKLEDMSLEELWELFPIIFEDNNYRFHEQYIEEANNLMMLLKSNIQRINHIGSTSISNIKTKPIIDILIEVIDSEHMEIVKNILLKNQYILMDGNIEQEKLSFNKGYTTHGYADKVFHIHVKLWHDCDELYFRDYLNEHIDIAKQYEQLKQQLYEKYAPNRDLYTEGKEEFVAHIVELAREKYKNRY